MSAPNDGGPVFPSQDKCPFEAGISLRDWFAGQAITGILAACSPGYEYTGSNAAISYANDAYRHADAMLTARNNLP